MELFSEEIKAALRRLRTFTSQELAEATEDYTRLLGEGAFSRVYRGVIDNNQLVAVKKYRNPEGEEEKNLFRNEIKILSLINHENIVKLIGCCVENDGPALIYEYISNGTLRDLVFENQSRTVSFDAQLQIAIGCAKALVYLHSLQDPIVYSNIKPENILLDDQLTPKLGDFGLALILPNNKIVHVDMVQGAEGYIDPLSLMFGEVTPKSDVFSFGVVLLQILTRMEATDHENGGALFYRFTSAYRDDITRVIHEMIDGQIKNEVAEEIILRVTEIAFKCLNLEKKERPEMTEVLNNLLDVQAGLTANHALNREPPRV